MPWAGLTGAAREQLTGRVELLIAQCVVSALPLLTVHYTGPVPGMVVTMGRTGLPVCTARGRVYTDINGIMTQHSLCGVWEMAA